MAIMQNSRLKRDRYPYRVLTRVVPLYALQVVRSELSMLWIRLTRPRTDRRFTTGMRLLVNVGCGSHGKAHWINVDSAAASGVTCIYDCRRRIPLRTGSARGIFTEHFVEHLDYEEEAPVFLKECRRVLEPGGVLRVVVPDGRKYLLGYAQGDWEALREFSPLLAAGDGGFQTRMEVVNAHFRQAGQHRYSYDYETLYSLLQRCGFERIDQRAFGKSRLPALAIDEGARSAESLYVEAASPGAGCRNRG